MSMSFEIFPTKKKIPKCDEIITYSVHLFSEFMQREKIAQGIEITIKEVSADNEVRTSPVSLVSKENNYTVFNLNEKGEVYIFYHELTEMDKEFWIDELQGNKNAQFMKEKIDTNLKIGYSWSVKKTMGQPAIISLFYGYLAIAIAVLTDGIIYSDDGAWDYSCLPIEGSILENEYLNLNKLSDVTIKENIEKWIDELRNSVAENFVNKSKQNTSK